MDLALVRRICVLGLLGLGLAGCAGASLGALGGPPSADRPGTQINLKNPDPTRWQPVAPSGPRKPGTPSVWICRPLTCSDNAVIAADMLPSPTRNPDSKTLETAAKLLAAQTRAQDVMLEAVSDGETRLTALSNKVTQVRGYPAITAEMKRVAGKRTRYLVRGDVFVGLFIVKVMSASDSRLEASRNFDAFMDVMDIVDVPPPAVVGAVTPTALESGNAARDGSRRGE